MHSIFKAIVLISLGVISGLALAGPDWDVINRARAEARQRNAVAAAKEARLARCDEMMKQMDSHAMATGTDGQPMTSPKGQADVR
ncbi:hypothetical protein CF70_002710 [Cupriavidus sp. SK-3]|uniref:hypothetical protein n=1 Tax=Cupriavidus sp. SK-3 TaxID=1470558 RepID=UPI00044A6A53|nr:hypothetical protein [Cupriavidus sp. SK-3]KDP87249.1 hypothetical protein CF70_002710 [Cupriavidus sp. SK-3]